MENFTFEQLPQAMRLLFEKMEHLELRLSEHLQPQDTEVIFNVTQAAAFLHLSVATVYVKTCRREIPFNKKGKRLYFYKNELAEWIRQGRKKTIPEIQQETSQHMLIKRKI
ncbi:helix-turn-helix domain-containing protein [Pontibacter sp. Tf4]|uniref:helix-turn-helix domain-containing protein n=1 Tax=Pontibacter sp. Tf4 TaxID=2761620 RepID=UPI001629FD7C|nr:helix-turn-helix domain-containing protein [Pontibacter sp. Tf4]MBB6611758.1 helix-turn-helix domain-containing protein [Pontibacter sp. Tf4]